MEVDGNTTGYEIINLSTVQSLKNGLIINFKILFSKRYLNVINATKWAFASCPYS